MREPIPTGAEAIPRQVACVRRRRNVHTVARALCAVTATGASFLALLVALALGTGERTFTAGIAILATACAFATGWLLRRAGLDWLRNERAPLWIDRSAGLEGRLATLLELRRRGADAFFLPLLEEENRQRLPLWQPHRLVPQRVPRAALAAAVVALTGLASVVALAPGYAPVPRQLVSDGEALRVVPVRPGEVPTRVTTGDTDMEIGQSDDAPATDVADEGEPTTIARVLQKRIRRELWGEEPGAERQRRPPGRGTPSKASDDAATEESWQVANDRSATDRRGRREEEPRSRSQLEAAGDEVGEESTRAPAGGDGQAAGDAAGASGAGTATDPNLFGPARGQGDAPSGRFELGIVARVRTRRAAPRPPTGEPPPAAPDERPVLGARQRQEIAVRRMIVPPAYEPIVRRVFAHGAEESR